MKKPLKKHAKKFIISFLTTITFYAAFSNLNTTIASNLNKNSQISNQNNTIKLNTPLNQNNGAFSIIVPCKYVKFKNSNEQRQTTNNEINISKIFQTPTQTSPTNLTLQKTNIHNTFTNTVGLKLNPNINTKNNLFPFFNSHTTKPTLNSMNEKIRPENIQNNILISKIFQTPTQPLSTNLTLQKTNIYNKLDNTVGLKLNPNIYTNHPFIFYNPNVCTQPTLNLINQLQLSKNDINASNKFQTPIPIFNKNLKQKDVNPSNIDTKTLKYDSNNEKNINSQISAQKNNTKEYKKYFENILQEYLNQKLKNDFRNLYSRPGRKKTKNSKPKQKRDNFFCIFSPFSLNTIKNNQCFNLLLNKCSSKHTSKKYENINLIIIYGLKALIRYNLKIALLEDIIERQELPDNLKFLCNDDSTNNSNNLNKLKIENIIQKYKSLSSKINKEINNKMTDLLTKQNIDNMYVLKEPQILFKHIIDKFLLAPISDTSHTYVFSELYKQNNLENFQNMLLAIIQRFYTLKNKINDSEYITEILQLHGTKKDRLSTQKLNCTTRTIKYLEKFTKNLILFIQNRIHLLNNSTNNKNDSTSKKITANINKIANKFKNSSEITTFSAFLQEINDINEKEPEDKNTITNEQLLLFTKNINLNKIYTNNLNFENINPFPLPLDTQISEKFQNKSHSDKNNYQTELENFFKNQIKTIFKIKTLNSTKSMKTPYEKIYFSLHNLTQSEHRTNAHTKKRKDFNNLNATTTSAFKALLKYEIRYSVLKDIIKYNLINKNKNATKLKEVLDDSQLNKILKKLKSCAITVAQDAISRIKSSKEKTETNAKNITKNMKENNQEKNINRNSYSNLAQHVLTYELFKPIEKNQYLFIISEIFAQNDLQNLQNIIVEINNRFNKLIQQYKVLNHAVPKPKSCSMSKNHTTVSTNEKNFIPQKRFCDFKSYFKSITNGIINLIRYRIEVLKKTTNLNSTYLQKITSNLNAFEKQVSDKFNFEKYKIKLFENAKNNTKPDNIFTNIKSGMSLDFTDDLKTMKIKEIELFKSSKKENNINFNKCNKNENKNIIIISLNEDDEEQAENEENEEKLKNNKNIKNNQNFDAMEEKDIKDSQNFNDIEEADIKNNQNLDAMEEEDIKDIQNFNDIEEADIEDNQNFNDMKEEDIENYNDYENDEEQAENEENEEILEGTEENEEQEENENDEDNA